MVFALDGAASGNCGLTDAFAEVPRCSGLTWAQRQRPRSRTRMETESPPGGAGCGVQACAPGEGLAGFPSRLHPSFQASGSFWVCFGAECATLSTSVFTGPSLLKRTPLPHRGGRRARSSPLSGVSALAHLRPASLLPLLLRPRPDPPGRQPPFLMNQRFPLISRPSASPDLSSSLTSHLPPAADLCP